MTEHDIHALHFEDFLNELIKEHGLTLKKLSELTGISIKHLEALSNGNFSNLPSSPYFRGYVMKLGQVLEFDPNTWWIKFKEGGFVKDAGTHDAPPANRFIRPAYVKFIWIGAATLLALIYVTTRLPAIIGKPAITVISPATNPAHVATNIIELTGNVQNGSDLSVNGEVVPTNPDGTWSQHVLLQSGMNTMEIRAKKFLGGETALIWEIFYEPTGANSSTVPLMPR